MRELGYVSAFLSSSTDKTKIMVEFTIELAWAYFSVPQWDWETLLKSHCAHEKGAYCNAHRRSTAKQNYLRCQIKHDYFRIHAVT